MPGIPDKYNYVYEAVLDNYKPIIDSEIDQDISEILSSMLSKKPENRPSASEVLKLMSDINC